MKEAGEWRYILLAAASGRGNLSLRNPYPDPSLIVFTDPVGGDTATDRFAEFPDDWIRRGNYGAWLIGMGLSDSGNALRNGELATVEERALTVLSIGKRKFAVIFPGPCDPFLWPNYLGDLWAHDLHRHGTATLGIYVRGIEINNLRNIETAVNSAASALPRDMTMPASAIAEFPEWFSGSILLTAL
jgi:hypothetical protein